MNLYAPKQKMKPEVSRKKIILGVLLLANFLVLSLLFAVVRLITAAGSDKPLGIDLLESIPPAYLTDVAVVQSLDEGSDTVTLSAFGESELGGTFDSCLVFYHDPLEYPSSNDYGLYYIYRWGDVEGDTFVRIRCDYSAKEIVDASVGSTRIWDYLVFGVTVPKEPSVVGMIVPGNGSVSEVLPYSFPKELYQTEDPEKSLLLADVMSVVSSAETEEGFIRKYYHAIFETDPQAYSEEDQELWDLGIKLSTRLQCLDEFCSEVKPVE